MVEICVGIHLRHIVGLFASIHYTNDQNNEMKEEKKISALF